jgi:hypothetical protein
VTDTVRKRAALRPEDRERMQRLSEEVQGRGSRPADPGSPCPRHPAAGQRNPSWHAPGGVGQQHLAQLGQAPAACRPDAAARHAQRLGHDQVVGPVDLSDNAQQRTAAFRQPLEVPPQHLVPLVGEQALMRLGARFRVALRRSLRVGKRWGGQPVEDLGVIPDFRYRLTSRDLLDGNADLMEKAGEFLARATLRTLDVDVASLEGSIATLEVTTGALRSLDIYVNSRPVSTVEVHDGKHAITVPLGDSTEVSVHLEGFDDGHLAAARTLRFTGSSH